MKRIRNQKQMIQQIIHNQQEIDLRESVKELQK